MQNTNLLLLNTKSNRTIFFTNIYKNFRQILLLKNIKNIE